MSNMGNLGHKKHSFPSAWLRQRPDGPASQQSKIPRCGRKQQQQPSRMDVETRRTHRRLAVFSWNIKNNNEFAKLLHAPKAEWFMPIWGDSLTRLWDLPLEAPCLATIFQYFSGWCVSPFSWSKGFSSSKKSQSLLFKNGGNYNFWGVNFLIN